jgi:phosphoglycolate phosphatase-like HAD superfamily hydrolase
MEDQMLGNIDGLPEQKARGKMIFFVIVIIILLIVSAVFIVLFIVEKTNKETPANESDESEKPKKGLTLWKECNAKKELVNYIEKITKPDSKDFIKKEDRIAVFDLDGTLFQETDLVYNDYKLFKYRVTEDPDYVDKATEEQKATVEDIKRMEKGESVQGLDIRHARANAEAFANMSLEEYDKYVKDFLSKPADGYNNMKRGEAFYQPMLEVIDYLQDNDFLIYICSGTDRFTVRALVDGKINIPKGNIIGTESLIVGNYQNETDYFEYVYHQNESLILKGEFVVKNLYMYKVYHIIREIGKIPILSFGNSNGDSSMANFVISNKDHPGLAFMLLCDDTERENGNIEKANKMKQSCEQNNWIPISMRDDWTTIYGNNVTRKKQE